MRLVFILEIFDDGGDLYVDSRLIAERLGIQHESFLRTIDNYQTRIESAFGGLRFGIGVPDKPTGNPPRYALLNEDQATFVMTLSRNSPEVVQCKLDLAIRREAPRCTGTVSVGMRAA